MLPQSSRNFLNAAALAPGVRISRDELRQEYSYGAQGSMNTNVFIDGTSYKNDVLQGGAVGQDSSRGNPFPQNAVQEFRVITQNFKAEYQKASSAIITAVTKSGDERAPRRGLRLLPEQEPRRDRRRHAAEGGPGRLRGRQARVHALAAGREPRRPDREGQGPLLRLVRGERPGPRVRGPAGHLGSLAPDLPAGVQAVRGALPERVPVDAPLRQADGDPRRQLERRRLRGLPSRDRHPRLRRRDELPGRRERQERRLDGPRQAHDHPRERPQRGDGQLPELQVEPGPAGLEHRRAELRRADADREQGLAAELHAGALRLPRRRHPAEPAVGRRARHQGGPRGRLPGLHVDQGAQRQPALQLPRRHLHLDPGRHAVQGESRLRRPGPLVDQHPVRPLPPGRLADQLPRHGEHRPSLGLRERHAQQRLRHAGRRSSTGFEAALPGELLHRRDASGPRTTG